MKSISGAEVKDTKYILNALLQVIANGIEVPKGDVGRSLIAHIQKYCPTENININSVGQTLRRIERMGLVERKTVNKTIILKLTLAGLARLEKIVITNVLPIQPSKLWDGQWRVVLFSIPENKKHLRVIFRQKLKSLGFIQLQRSTWLFPYTCEEEISLLASRLGISEQVIVLLVSSLPGSKMFEEHFGLNPEKQSETIVLLESLADSSDEDISPLVEIK